MFSKAQANDILQQPEVKQDSTYSTCKPRNPADLETLVPLIAVTENGILVFMSTAEGATCLYEEDSSPMGGELFNDAVAMARNVRNLRKHPQKMNTHHHWLGTSSQVVQKRFPLFEGFLYVSNTNWYPTDILRTWQQHKTAEGYRLQVACVTLQIYALTSLLSGSSRLGKNCLTRWLGEDLIWRQTNKETTNTMVKTWKCKGFAAYTLLRLLGGGFKYCNNCWRHKKEWGLTKQMGEWSLFWSCNFSQIWQGDEFVDVGFWIQILHTCAIQGIWATF